MVMLDSEQKGIGKNNMKLQIIISRLLLYFTNSWKYVRVLLIISFSRNLFIAFLALFDVIGLGVIVDGLIDGKTSAEILYLIVAYLSINLVIGITNQMLLLLENKEMRKASNIQQYKYMEDCLKIDYHYVQDQQILNFKKQSMVAQPAFSLTVFSEAFGFLIQTIGTFTIFLSLSSFFVIIVLIVAILVLYSTIYVRKKEFDFQNSKVEDDRKLEYIYEVMTQYKYAKEIRINDAKGYLTQKYYNLFVTQKDKFKKMLRKKSTVESLAACVVVLQTSLMYFYFTYQVWSSNIQISEYTILIASTTLFINNLLALFNKLGFIGNCIRGMEYWISYESILKEKSTVSESNSKPNVMLDYENAEITFENVSFVYPSTSNKIFDNLNCTFSAHQKIGIVGLNGSGKTTLIKLLLRLYSPTSGKITMNGVDISDIPYDQYVKHFGIILQDFTIFAYSIKDNIILNNAYDKSILLESIKKSDMEDRISRLPKTIDTSVFKILDDDGIELSGGEGQKIALARAIYKNAEILIMDEPSSSLDPIAENRLFSNLYEIAGNKTTFFISHRLSSTQLCDHIIVLQNGSIVEEGTHKTLMQNNKLYADLYNAQAQFYKDIEVTKL